MAHSGLKPRRLSAHVEETIDACRFIRIRPIKTRAVGMRRRRRLMGGWRRLRVMAEPLFESTVLAENSDVSGMAPSPTSERYLCIGVVCHCSSRRAADVVVSAIRRCGISSALAAIEN